MQTRRFIKLEFKIKAPFQRCFCLWTARHSAHKLLRIFMSVDATYRPTLIFTAKISFTALPYLHFTCIIFVNAYLTNITLFQKNLNSERHFHSLWLHEVKVGLHRLHYDGVERVVHAWCTLSLQSLSWYQGRIMIGKTKLF